MVFDVEFIVPCSDSGVRVGVQDSCCRTRIAQHAQLGQNPCCNGAAVPTKTGQLSHSTFIVLFVLMFLDDTVFLLLPATLFCFDVFSKLEPFLPAFLTDHRTDLANPKISHAAEGCARFCRQHEEDDAVGAI